MNATRPRLDSEVARIVRLLPSLAHRHLRPLSATAVASVLAIAVGTTVALVGVPSFESASDFIGLDATALVIVASLSVFAIGTYVVWPSRWNIPAHLQIGFCLTAYVIPVYVLRTPDNYEDSLVESFAAIVGLGAVCTLTGLILGSLGARLLRLRLPRSLRPPSDDVLRRVAWRRIPLPLALAVAGMVLAFGVMGFVPLLADDPLSAKYFRGAYDAPYQRVAPLFVLSLGVVSTLVSVTLVAWLATRGDAFLILGLAGLGVMVLTLQRGPIAFGALTVLGLVAAYRRGWFPAYLFLVVLLVPFGGAIFYLAGTLFGFGSFTAFSPASDLLTAVAAGAPDLNDGFRFLSSFQAFGEFTQGRTFYGGLVPGRYEWNPAVWSVSIAEGGADASEVPSGGLRLPVAIWGYTAFGWLGAAAVPLVSGLILGAATYVARLYVGTGSLLQSALVLLLYTTVAGQLAGFYVLSIHAVPNIAIAIFLLYAAGALTRRAGSASLRAPPHGAAQTATPAER